MSKKTFSINNKLYPENLINSVILAFDGYNISYFDSTITIDDEDTKYVFDELMNYVLSISSETIVWV